MRSDAADSRVFGSRILVLGAGVIGSLYAGRLLACDWDVTVLARGQRQGDLHNGLQLLDADSGQQLTMPVETTTSESADAFDLVIVAVRNDQLASTVPILDRLTGRPDILFFGNTAGQMGRLQDAFHGQVMFGFPAVGGGILSDGVVRYVQIRQQKTMLAEASGGSSRRLERLRLMLNDAGFPTAISQDPVAWMSAHLAFVVPIACALQREGFDAQQLARNPQALRRMVRATRQAYRALRSLGNTEIPTNLAALYLHSPQLVAVQYWKQVFASERGELWFAAHSRRCPGETHSLAIELLAATRQAHVPTPDLEYLLTP